MEVFFMEITGENGLGRILKVFLQTFFFGGIILLIIWPFQLKILGLELNAIAAVIYPNGIALLAIVYQFIGLFDSLKNNNPFCMENVKRMKYAGIAALVEAILWGIDLIYEIVFAKSQELLFIAILIFLFILFIGVAIALYMLSELFKQATEYKTENELTI